MKKSEPIVIEWCPESKRLRFGEDSVLVWEPWESKEEFAINVLDAIIGQDEFDA